MKMAIRNMLLILSLVVMVAIVSACGGNDESTIPVTQTPTATPTPVEPTPTPTPTPVPVYSLAGRWEAVSIEWIGDGESFTEYVDAGEFSIEFFSDGNGAMVEGRDTDRFTWSAENGRLMMTYGGWETILSDYRISGSTLTITIEENRGTEIMTFRRLN